MFWFIVVLLLLGAGFYLYQKLTALEAEIRAEQLREKEASVAAEESNAEKVASDEV